MSKLNGNHSCLLTLLQSLVLIQVKPKGGSETGMEWNPDFEYKNKSNVNRYFIDIAEGELEGLAQELKDIIDEEENE